MWPIKTLGEVATWGSGGTPKRSRAEYFGEGVPWLSIADLNDGVVTQAKESLTALGLQNSSAKLVPAGTLLVSMYGSIGKLGVAAMDLCTSQAIAFARPHPEVIDARYLFHFLLAERPRLQRHGRGGTQMNISQGDLKAWPIPLPPLDDQRRIAAILDQADALIAKRRQALAHIDDLTLSIFLEMFGNPDDAVSAGSFRYFSDVVGELQGGKNLVAADSGLPVKNRVLKISAVTGFRYRPWESKPLPNDYAPPEEHFVRRGDLLMSRANTTELVGAVALVDSTPHNLVLPDKLWRFVWRDPASVEPLYVWALFQTRAMRRELSARSSGTGGSMKNISKAKLSNLRMPWPSLAKQQEFARRLTLVMQLRRQGDGSGFNELFHSLQTRAFSGRL